MTSKQITYLLLGLLIFLFAVDILIRMFYCSSVHLSFNSQEFNNICSPIISLLGFFGVIITISLALKQFKHQQGSNYFNYYRDYINNIANENPITNDNLVFSTSELLQFPIYSWDKFDELKKYPEYFHDLEKFRSGETVNSENKPYDKILINVRLFSGRLDILLKRYISLIIEIDTHKTLDNSQKSLLLKGLFDSQVEKYYNGCWLMETDNELKEIKDSFYNAFASVMKDQLLVFNSNFYKLKVLIDKRPDLKKHTQAYVADEK